MAQRQPIKIGLIGLGKMGQNHLRVLSLLKSVELVFVYDLNTKAAEQLGETYSVQTHVDLQQLLPQVDAVVICTPTVTHGDYIRIAAGYVKNIFVEKPMADSLEEAQALSAFAAEHPDCLPACRDSRSRVR